MSLRALSTFPVLVAGATLFAGCAGRSATTPLVAVAPVLSPRQALVAAIDSMVSTPQFRNAHWGILIVDPERGDTLYSRNAGKLFMPASNMKIVTGAVALAELGADYRFRTAFVSDGPFVGGTLKGNLVIEGRGDPTLSDAMRRGDTTVARELRTNAMTAMRDIADSLALRGVRRIDGRLLRGADIFPDSPWGYAWGWDQFEYPYSAGVDELFFNEGFTRVIVRGGARAGDPVTVTTTPIRSHPTVRSVATTIVRNAQDTTRTRSVEVINDTLSAGILVTGTIAAGDSTVLTISYRDQNAAYLAALREALQAKGIVVGDAIIPRGARADTVFTTRSAPLRDILARFEKPSQNQIGEILLKTLALEKTDTGTSAKGRAVVRDKLISWGVDSLAFVVRDGSGLSRHNYVTPEALVTILATIQKDTAFRAFYDALPIAGVDGSISTRMRNTPAAGNMRAKTGFIDKARSLSGYITTADGRILVFSFLANNWTTSSRAVDQVQNEIGARLAALRLDR